MHYEKDDRTSVQVSIKSYFNSQPRQKDFPYFYERLTAETLATETRLQHTFHARTIGKQTERLPQSGTFLNSRRFETRLLNYHRR